MALARTTPLSPRFIWGLALLVQAVRFLGLFIVLIFPNFRDVHDLMDLWSVNDGKWYMQMATGGYIQYDASGNLYTRLADFSTLLPILIWVFGTVFTPAYAPVIINLLCTLPVPWLAAKFAPKLIPTGPGGPTADQAWRQKLVVLGLTLNPILIGYSIYALTEPLFYLLLLCVLNCNQHQGVLYFLGELVALFFLGWVRFMSLLICAFYAYQLVIRDFLNKDYKNMLRPLACIFLSGVNFLLWDYVFPVSQYGISASDAMAKWWGVKMDFNPNSIFFPMKLGIITLAVVGGITVLRMLAIRKNWSIFGMRDKYLADLRREGRTPAADGLVTDHHPEFGTEGAIGPYNYELIEALFFYGFCVFAFQGMLNPLFSFFRYTGAIIAFFGCISFQNRFTNNAPALGMMAIVGATASNIGVFVVLLYYSFAGGMPTGLIDPTITNLKWWPEMILNIALIVVVLVLFFKYYYAIKASQYAKPPKSPDLKKLTIYLALMSLVLCFFNFYMP